MFFTTILKIAVLLGSIQTVIVWLGRLIRLLGQTIVMLQNVKRPNLTRAYVRR